MISPSLLFGWIVRFATRGSRISRSANGTVALLSPLSIKTEGGSLTFSGSNAETHVEVGSHRYCVWFVTTESGPDIASTHVREQVTDIVKRKEGADVLSGTHTFHLSPEMLSAIVSALARGQSEWIFPSIQYTSIWDASAQTLLFEQLA